MSDAENETTLAGVILNMLTPALGALFFWLAWNHFTDAAHPLRYGYVLVTMYAVAVPRWLVAVGAFAAKR